MKKGILLAAVVTAMMLLGSVSAMAKTSDVKVVDTDEGYGYDFKDDILESGVGGIHSARINVRQGAMRRTLIRPRTHFVAEMLKSVEKI